MAEAPDWDEAYRRGSDAPWDIHRPQPAVLRLGEEGQLVGDLLDAGCGTGEHTLLAASYGARARGVDLSPTAIERARQKATARGLDVTFDDGDILTIPLPDNGFDVVVDSGLFHVFDDDDRRRYVARLHALLRAGGHAYVLCFSDRQPGDWGPRRVTEAEIRTAFAAGWSLQRIEPITFDINPLPEATEVQGWLVDAARSAS